MAQSQQALSKQDWQQWQRLLHIPFKQFSPMPATTEKVPTWLRDNDFFLSPLVDNRLDVQQEWSLNNQKLLQNVQQPSITEDDYICQFPYRSRVIAKQLQRSAEHTDLYTRLLSKQQQCKSVWQAEQWAKQLQVSLMFVDEQVTHIENMMGISSQI